MWLHGPDSATKYTSVLKGSIFEIGKSKYSYTFSGMYIFCVFAISYFWDKQLL